jgi:2-haloacid dehalogenase
MLKLITFDVYTAVLDLFGSAIPIVKEILDLSDAECDKFFRAWRANQSQQILLSSCLNVCYQNFRYLTTISLDYTTRKLNLQITSKQKKYLIDDVWKNLKAWPDVKEITERLKSDGYKIALLSNGDYDLLKPLEKSTGITFDYIFSGDMAQSHKPCSKIYYLPLIELGIGRTEMLHVPGGSVDVMGIKAAGFHCAWCNRFNDYILDPGYQPDFIMKNLYDLPDIIKTFNERANLN